jgi:flagellar hook-associated protein 2
MGTVGLSFGSPTSGAGFDVSTTVSEIVANLQNVETPWKSELTTLGTQDTTISSLGTLLSNLSSDMSSLTDATGVLAEKTGSSSNTNVLELTAASTSAVAGTHTVAANSLAQTSSGYMAELASASDTLSGSITLQVGSGTAQTITLDSSDDTLSGLASAINSSNVGITASVLTDATGSRLSLVSGTSGANGNITVSDNKLTAAVSNTQSATVTAGSSSVNSSAMFSPVTSPSETLTGTVSIQVGSRTAIPVDMSEVSTVEGGAALSDLASYINSNFTTQGVQASVVTNSDGTSSLRLNSQTPGSAGTLTVNSSLVDSETALAYTSAVTGSNASLTVDGVNLTSASNTVTNLIPGITFQLLSTSSTPVQVVIANDNSDVESTFEQFVSDYNALVSAINTQEGNTSSGTAEPLFGSPTLSLLQQEILGGINTQNSDGYLGQVPSTGTTLSGSLTIQGGSGTAYTFEIGAEPSSGAESNTYYTGSGSDYNTREGRANAINAAAGSTSVDYTAASDDESGTTIAATDANLTGTLEIETSSGTTNTIYLGSSDDAPSGDVATGTADNTLSSLESFLNDNSSTLGVTASIVDNGDGTSTLTLSSTGSSALTVTSNVEIPGLGVSAAAVTKSGESTLALTSGSSGALKVTSALTATTAASLSYTSSGYTSTTADSGAFGTVASSSDSLSGSMTIQVGSGTATTIDMSDVETAEDGTTLADLESYINLQNLGFTASPDSAGTALTLTSGTTGSGGALTVTSSVLDSGDTSSSSLSYTNSSDINSMSALGISVNTDGTISLDESTLDSVLNADFSGVQGLFQNVDSWGLTFSNILTNAGTSSTGILGLASSSNSSIESMLNAEISKEESYISLQQSSLTTALNSANEIMQELPTQLEGMNELYSAITGYNQGNS